MLISAWTRLPQRRPSAQTGSCSTRALQEAEHIAAVRSFGVHFWGFGPEAAERIFCARCWKASHWIFPRYGKAFPATFICRTHCLLPAAGGKSALWREIFAGIFGIKIKKGSIGQNAASFGAAAIALRCAGLWEDYTPINRQCSGGALTEPAAEHETAYRLLRQRYRAARRALESFTQENQNIPSM